MIYLLCTPQSNLYMLMERDDYNEYFFNYGDWTSSPPYTAEALDDFTTEPVERTVNGTPINWWLPKYQDFTDAKCIKRFKTLDQYKQWILLHSELLI